jgi:hypothetical protein
LIAQLADLLKAADPCEEWREPFNRHLMGLSEFHDTLLAIILQFGSDIGDGHRRGEIYLIRRRPFSYLAF